MKQINIGNLNNQVLYKTCYIFGNIFPIVQCCPHLLSTNSNLSVGCALVHNFDRKDALRCVCSWKICNLRPVCFVIVNSKIFVKATSTTVVTLLCTYLQHYSILWYAISTYFRYGHPTPICNANNTVLHCGLLQWILENFDQVISNWGCRRG